MWAVEVGLREAPGNHQVRSPAILQEHVQRVRRQGPQVAQPLLHRAQAAEDDLEVHVAPGHVVLTPK